MRAPFVRASSSKSPAFLSTVFLFFVAMISTSHAQQTYNFAGQSYTQEGESMNGAPSLAVLNSRLYIAFRAQNGVNTLFLDTSADATTLTGAQEQTGIKMGSTPYVIAYNNQLVVAFKSNSNDDLFLCYLTPNTNRSPITYSATCHDNPQILITGTPSMTVANNNLYVAYMSHANNNVGIFAVNSAYGTVVNEILNTQAGTPPAIAYMNGQTFILAFQSDNSGHYLDTQTSTDGINYGPVYTSSTQINSTPSLTATTEFPSNQTLSIAFWGNSPNTNLWFENYYGSMLQGAVQDSALVGSSPAQSPEWKPLVGQYSAASEAKIVSIAFRSQNSNDRLFLGNALVQY